MGRIDGTCMICHKEEKVRHLPLYVIGSEGLVVCHSCEMELVHYIRKLMGEYTRLRISQFKELKRQREVKKGGDHYDIAKG